LTSKTCTAVTVASRAVSRRFRIRGPRTGKKKALLIRVILMLSAFIMILAMPKAIYGVDLSRKICAKRCCLHILNYRQIFENLYFLLNAGTKSPDGSTDYQRSTVHRPFSGAGSANWLMTGECR